VTCKCGLTFGLKRIFGPARCARWPRPFSLNVRRLFESRLASKGADDEFIQSKRHCRDPVLPVDTRDRNRTGQVFRFQRGSCIRYVQQGNGDAILLIHNFGNNLERWISVGVLPNLARDYRVIAFDVRGHGKSEKPQDATGYGREIGLDAIRLLDHLGIQKAHIIGYSMGARLTAQLLTTHSERFITATLGGHAGLFRWTREDAELFEQEASEIERECVSRSQIYRLAPTNAPKPDEEEIKRISGVYGRPQ
jgi:pimeloyl-ACP methyl ester carboxylesterase